MRTGWRIILTIVVVAILLGAICFGVGLLTGANPDRIHIEWHEVRIAFVEATVMAVETHDGE